MKHGNYTNEIPTVEMRTPKFGTPVKAEFYPIQTNPETSNGQFVLKADSAEEVYVLPSRLLMAIDIANVDVVDSATGSILKRVDIALTPAGRSKIQTFISAMSADHPIALLWRNQVYHIYPAYKLDSGDAVTVVEGVTLDFATALAAALK